MCFSIPKVVEYLVDQFQYYLRIRCIKTIAVLKCQLFEDSESEETEPGISKRQCVCVDDNEER